MSQRAGNPSEQGDCGERTAPRPVALPVLSPPMPCPYLPDRESRSEVFLANWLDPAMYETVLAQNFRRSGGVIYRPRCEGCDQCREYRVIVDDFRMTRSMRRVRNRNIDLRIEVGDPVATSEKFDIFRRYLDAQHDGTMARDFESFHEFLYNSPIETIEVQYSLGWRVIGASILDVCERGLSSVYMYFDPDFAGRSLGTFSAITEIEHCRKAKLPYYYMGFLIENCKTMAYKARFGPGELLVGGDTWVPYDAHAKGVAPS